MTVENRLEALKRKHAQLHEEIEERMKSPSIPDSEIRTMKRQKLAIKDQIETASRI